MNDFDCGVFLCKFAHQIMQLRHTEFTAIVDDFKNVKTRKPIIDKWIGEHIKCSCDQDSVTSLRCDLLQLITCLSALYMKNKE